MNVSKTKDMCIDFRCAHPPPVSLVIDGQSIEIVESYKYLGTILDTGSFERNTDVVYKKPSSVSFASENSPSPRLIGP